MGEPVEQCGRHLGVSEDARPFAEAEVGGDDDRGPLVELAEQVEQQGATGRAERQISQLIEDHEIEAGQAFSDLPRLSLGLLLFEGVDQFNGGEEADLAAVMLDGLDAEGGCDVGLPRAVRQRS